MDVDRLSQLERQVEQLMAQLASFPVRFAGGGGTITGDLNVHFGRVTATIMPAIGWKKTEWGQGTVQELDILGDPAGNPFTLYSRFFERVLTTTPVWFVYLGTTPVLLVPGCFGHA